MSLVNDLLIELDRQHEDARRNPSQFLAGLSPRRNSRPRSTRWRIASIVALVSTAIFLVGGLAIFAFSPTPDSAFAPPPVSASPQIAAAPIPTAMSTRAPELRIERAPSLRSLTIQDRDDATRMRFEIAGAATHRIEQADDNRSLDLILDSAGLAAPLSNLDLDGTPIRSISAHSDNRGLRIAFDFDAGLRINSQSLETADGTTLFIDLLASEPSFVSSRPGVPSEDRIERSPRSSEAMATRPHVAAARWTDTLNESDRTTAAANRKLAFAPGANLAIAPSGELAIAPSGNLAIAPSGELAIARSQGDRNRKDRDTARELASQEIAAAQVARSEGDLIEAERRYAAAIEFSPEHPDATLQRATLLAEMSRTQEAIELIRTARRANHRDARLAMLHAHLLESSERRAEAIELLDRAGFSLTEAPDVHALAAAYLQRAGEHALAIDRYESIVRRYPGKSQWWMGLGISLEAEDRRAEAADVYRIAMQIGDLTRPTRRWVGGRIDALGEGD